MVSICSRVMGLRSSLRGAGAKEPSDARVNARMSSASGPQRDARQPPPPDSGAAAGIRAVGPDDIVVLRDVKKTFNDQEVLKGIDLVAKRKETVVIIGGSGAGK